MTEKDILQKINKLKQISLSSSQKEEVFLLIQKKVISSEKRRFHLFSIFNRKYQVGFVFALLIIFASSTLVLANNSLPDSPLYSLKMFYQNAKIAFTKKENKAEFKALFLKERLNDLKKVNSFNNERILKIANSLKEDLKTLPNEITQLNKQKEILKVSQNVKKTTEKMKEISNNIPLALKKEINNTLEETNQKIYSLILETEDKINNCPSYLSKNLEDLRVYFENSEYVKNYNPKEILEVKNTLNEIDSLMKAGDCLGALEKIESLNQIKLIHSLRVLNESSVDSSPSESLDQK